VNESGLSATITVVRTGVTNTAVGVSYSSTNGTALTPNNYTAVSGSLFFSTNGETSHTFTVPIIDNGIIGGSKTVLLSLSNPTNSFPLASTILLNPNAAVLTIVDNDGSVILPAGAALTHESFSPTNGYVDPGETVTMLLALRNASGQSTTNLLATLLNTNGIATAGQAQQSYGVLVPGGPSSFRPFTFTATGTNGSVVNATLQLFDGTLNLGTATFSFGLGSVTNNYTNSAPIIINAYGAATPYPSTNVVAGLNGSVSKVVATVYQFEHQYMSDVSLLLQSPANQEVLLMSHVGGGHIVTNLNLGFDDGAPGYLSFISAPVSGVYKPTDESVDVGFSLFGKPPGPAGPYTTNMASFSGGNPNGNWYLYVLDDQPEDGGSIDKGWTLSLITSSPPQPEVDLAAGIASAQSQVVVGSNFTYSVTLTNFGPSFASEVMATNVLPPGVSLVSAVVSEGSVSNYAGTLVFNFGGLGANSNVSATVILTPLIAGQLTNGQSVILTNSFVASAQQDDPNPANNTAVLLMTVTPSAADLAVGLIGTPDPVLVGSNVTYLIAVTNFGPATASSVTLTDSLPAGVSVVSSGGGATSVPGFVTWNLGTLGSLMTTNLTLVLRPTLAGTITNTVNVASAIVDPFKANNLAAAKTIVSGGPQLMVSQQGGGLVISWPATASFVLESTPSLVAPVTWTLVPVTFASNGTNSVTITASSAAQFYRLSTSP
jgi:uncharacterized repeat protein (TIGR01451 family)